MTIIRPVPFDPELEAILAGFPADPNAEPLRRETIPSQRAGMAALAPTVAELIDRVPVEAEDRRIPGPPGAPEIEVTILRPAGHDAARSRPGLYNIHGGGMIMGTRGMDTARLIELVLHLGVVAVNVEYRLAPEHPDPAPVEDCYAGLQWMSAHAAELGVDPARIVVTGGSAGGGLSAGVALLARDRRGPRLAGQLLLCPMIDDTNTTVSSHQYSGLGTWTREMNLVAWDALLGDPSGRGPVSPYAAPTREPELSGLPPAFIEAGSAELFRDENVAYASRIWAAGGSAELHVWSGGFHGFDVFAPGAALTVAALRARESWLRRILALPETEPLAETGALPGSEPLPESASPQDPARTPENRSIRGVRR